MALLDILAMMPSFLIIGGMIWLYVFNRGVNKKLMDKAVVQLEPALQKIGIQSLLLITNTITGRKYNTKVEPSSNLRNTVVYFTMEDRHLLPSWVITKITRNPRDFVVIETDIRDVKPLFSMEIISLKAKNQLEQNKKKLVEMEDIVTHSEKFDDTFIIKTSNKQAAMLFFKTNSDFLKLLYSCHETLVRVSLDKAKSPSFRVLAKLNVKTNPETLSRIVYEGVTTTADVSTKRYIRERRTD